MFFYRIQDEDTSPCCNNPDTGFLSLTRVYTKDGDYSRRIYKQNIKIASDKIESIRARKHFGDGFGYHATLKMASGMTINVAETKGEVEDMLGI